MPQLIANNMSGCFFSETRCRWLYCVECPQYSIQLEAVGCPCRSCLLLHSTMFSVTCLCLSDVGVICGVIYSFDSGLLFFRNGQRGSTAEYLVYPILDPAKNLG